MDQPEDVLPDYLAALTERLILRAGALAGVLTRKLRDPAKILARFIQRQLNTVGFMRTLVAPDQKFAIRDLFVRPSVRLASGKVVQPSASWVRSHDAGILLVGASGTGKTLLLRSLALEAIEQGGALPIYLELRSLNDTQSVGTVRDLVLELLRESRVELTSEELASLFDDGAVVLFADGLDEVAQDRRAAVLRELRQIQEGEPEKRGSRGEKPEKRDSRKTRALGCRAVVTSRDELGFVVDGFEKCKVSTLTLQQATDLVRRLPLELAIRSGFVKALEAELFAKHASFARNPLLLTILVITHAVGGAVPAREAEFYDVAYYALFRRHDALTKPGFARQRKTPLDGSQFAGVFACFSMLSFGRRQFEFTEQAAVDLAAIALQELGWLNVSAEDFVDDCVRAVCLLMPDGTKLVFAHRSFQEYFAARFVWLHTEGHSREALLRALVSTARQDKVIELLNEMAPEVVRGNLLLPFLRELRREGVLVPVPRYSHIVALCEFCDLCNTQAGWMGNENLDVYLGVVAFLRSIGEIRSETLALLPTAPPHPSTLPSERRIIPSEGDSYDRELLEFLLTESVAFALQTVAQLDLLESKLARRECTRNDFLRRLLPGSY